MPDYIFSFGRLEQHIFRKNKPNFISRKEVDSVIHYLIQQKKTKIYFFEGKKYILNSIPK